MKQITITCDQCDKELQDQFIEIGSTDEESLYFENSLPKGRGFKVTKLEDFCNLHFCSTECFQKFFFDRTKHKQ